MLLWKYTSNFLLQFCNFTHGLIALLDMVGYDQYSNMYNDNVNCTKCEVPAFCLYWLAIIVSRMVNGHGGARVEKLLMTKLNKIKKRDPSVLLVKRGVQA